MIARLILFARGRRVIVALALAMGLMISGVFGVRWWQRSATAIHRAAYEGESDRLILAINQHPASIDALRSFWPDPRLTEITPLMWAAKGGHPGAVELLLQQGADVLKVDRFGRTALWFAAERGDVESARILLAAGAAPNAKISFGSSPLMEAAANGYCDLAELLINNGADVDLQVGGHTALSQAVRAGQVNATAWLLNHGAKIPEDDASLEAFRRYLDRLSPATREKISELMQR